MAEEIVSCPGCAKKFRIPEGADPGAFDCTACGASVVYGKSAAPGGGGGGGGKRGRRGARRAKARRGAAAGGGREGGGGGRRGDAAPPPTKQESKTPIIVTSIIAVVVIAGLLAMRMFKDDKPAETGQTNGDSAIKTGSISSEGGEGDATPTDTAPKKPPVVVPDEPVEPSGIGGAEDTSKDEDRPPSYQEYYLQGDDVLFVRYDNLPDMTDEERAEIDVQVALMIDPDAGIEGRRAIDVIEKAGRKAVPSLLSTFQGQTWDNENDQRAAHQVQQRLWTIIGADRDQMPSDLFARFNPSQPVPKEHFRRAAKMWTAKWLAEFQFKESFRPFEDEEEE